MDHWENHPQYACDLIWGDDEGPNHLTPTLDAESMLPLLPTSSNELDDPVACHTIWLHLHILNIVTPDHLESYLASHPNKPLVASVMYGLWYGSWPFAITNTVDHPTIVDNSHQPLRDTTHIEFAQRQYYVEVALGHFSPAFDNLLPQMTSVPVPKSHSVDLHLVIEQTAGDFSPNSYIPKEGVAVALDNLHDLGCHLL